MRSIGSSRIRRWALLVSVAMFAVLLIPFAGPAAANHGDRDLDAEPENPTLGVGATHTITARLCENDPTNVEAPNNCDTNAPADQDSGAIRIHFENENGPNDPDDSPSRTSPDATCNIFPVSTTPSSCSISYVGLNAGTDTWRVWIDHDSSQATDNSDPAEGRNETTTPGAPGNTCGDIPGPAEPDCTDVVQVTWAEGGPARLDCDDETGPDTERETNASGGGQSNETYSCEVRDAQGNLTGDGDPNTTGVQRFRVHGEVENGVNDPQQDGATYATEDYGCFVGRPNTTDEEEGKCEITVTQAEGELGTAEICFWVGTLDEQTGSAACGSETTGESQAFDGSDTGNDLADQVEKTWEQRNEGPATQLNCEPENVTRERTEDRTITCTASNSGGGVPDVNIDIEATGANDPDDPNANSPEDPDFTCTTGSAGSCQVVHEGAESNDLGETIYRAWVDSDNDDTTTEADETEGQNEGTDAGANEEPDTTDVVKTTWVAVSDRSISLNTNRTQQEKGKRVRFFGSINGDPNCEAGETVRLRGKKRGGGYRTIATTVTNNDGDYSFRIVVRRTRNYKTVAPATTTPDACDRAASNPVRVVVN